MIEYKKYLNSSISMSEDEKLKKALLSISLDVEVIIESGTYLGLGSTLTLANIFSPMKNFQKLITCEVNWMFYKQAKKNLKNFEKVECKYGRTVDFKEAYNFIINDDVLKNHHLYPQIYIDDISDPQKFYLNELKGNLERANKISIINKIKQIITPFQKSLLSKLISSNIDKKLLIVLDSAGGIGYLEFKIISDLLSKSTYYVLLDDIHHLKHFRSYAELIKSPKAILVDSEYENGWALFKITN